MKTSVKIQSITAALLGVQAEIENAVKDKTNPAFRSMYASLGAVLDAAKPALSRHKVLLVQSPYVAENGNIGVETRLIHESGEWMESRVAVASKGDAQAAGGVVTYLRRYALASMLGITQEDDDGNSVSNHAPLKQTAPPAQQAAPTISTVTAPPKFNVALDAAMTAGRQAATVAALTVAFHTAVKAGASDDEQAELRRRKEALLNPDKGLGEPIALPCRSCGCVDYAERSEHSCSNCMKG